KHTDNKLRLCPWQVAPGLCNEFERLLLAMDTKILHSYPLKIPNPFGSCGTLIGFSDLH
ncbi:744_t:CDS:1, partial [Cetraspora pellucida]